MLAMSKRSLSMHRSQLSHTPMPPKSSVPGVLNVPASIRNTDSSAKQAQHPRRRPNPAASRSNQPQQPLPHQRHRRARSQSQPPATTTATSPVGVSSSNPIHSPVPSVTLASSELPQLPLAENDDADAPLPAILSQPSGRIARARAQKHQRRQPPTASSQSGNNDSPQQGVAQQDSGSSTAKARASRRNVARPKSKGKGKNISGANPKVSPIGASDRKEAGSGTANPPRQLRSHPRVNTDTGPPPAVGVGSPSGSRKRNRQLIVEDDFLDAMELDEHQSSSHEEGYFSMSDVEGIPRPSSPPQAQSLAVPSLPVHPSTAPPTGFAPSTPPPTLASKPRNPYSPPKTSAPRPASLGSAAALASIAFPTKSTMASPPSTPSRSFAAAAASSISPNGLTPQGHRRTQSHGVIPSLSSLSSLSSFNSFGSSTSGSSATSFGTGGIIGLGIGAPTGSGSPFPSPRYAASTFQHSPKPDGLPKPRFLMNAAGNLVASGGASPFGGSANTTPTPLANFVVARTPSPTPGGVGSEVPSSSSWSGPLSSLFSSDMDTDLSVSNAIGTSVLASSSTPNLLSTAPFPSVAEEMGMDVEMS